MASKKEGGEAASEKGGSGGGEESFTRLPALYSSANASSSSSSSGGGGSGGSGADKKATTGEKEGAEMPSTKAGQDSLPGKSSSSEGSSGAGATQQQQQQRSSQRFSSVVAARQDDADDADEDGFLQGVLLAMASSQGAASGEDNGDDINKGDSTSFLEIKDRTWMLKTYKDCFVGSECVTWFIKQGFVPRQKHKKGGKKQQSAAESPQRKNKSSSSSVQRSSNNAELRKEAVELGNELMTKLHAFHHVTRDHQFKDEKLFYRLRMHDRSHGHLDESEGIASWTRFLPDAMQRDGNEGSPLVSVLPDVSSKWLNSQLGDEAEGEEVGTTGAGDEVDYQQMMHDINVKPLDKANLKLLDRVRPPMWVNPKPQKKYNLVAIGAGAGGLVSAAGSAGVGARVALVEMHMLGGDCLNFGCVPSKALIRCANAAAEARRGRRFGVYTTPPGTDASSSGGEGNDADDDGADTGAGAGGAGKDEHSHDDATADDGDTVSMQGHISSHHHQFGADAGENEVHVDFGRVMERMRKLRAQIAENDAAKRFASLGIDVYIGHGEFKSKKSILVKGADGSEHTLKFAKCVIAAGARPAVPKIDGILNVAFLTNYTVFNLTELPKRFGVIGTGPIGCELAQAFARFGSKVTVFGRSGQILGREDRDAADIVQREMETDGVEFRMNCKFKKISQNDDGSIAVSTEDGDVVVDRLLVSTGRRPNVEKLNVKAAGVQLDAGGVKVNDFLQTTNSNIFAVGDVCTPYKFTHMADAMARLVIRNALFFGSGRVSKLTVPWATFTSPEVAHVGLYEHDLEASGVKFETFQKRFDQIDRGICDGEPEGCFVKVHVAAGTDQILGATIVNEHAGDMISEITVCMAAGLGLAKLAAVIHPYPTQAEAIRMLGDEFNRTRLTPAVKIMFRKLMSARR